MLPAATKGKPASQELLIGSLAGGLNVTNAPVGPLTRPAWAPGLSEVWIGAGGKLLRVPQTGTGAVPVTLASSSGSVTGLIQSVAFSSDGVRIALIIGAADGSSQLWIGTIVRTADGVSVDSLAAITPVGLKLTDVAWNDSSTLYTIGTDTTVAGNFGIWAVQIDGSLLTPRDTTNLPGAADSITASRSGLTWVSAKQAVWTQRGLENSWVSPGPSSTTYGTSPTYVQ